MTLTFKPRVTLRKQFVLPLPFRAWCHYCKKGFASLDELTAHNKDKMRVHQGNVQI